MILATILCGRCADEKRRAEKLGTVEKHGDGLFWGALDPKEARQQKVGGSDVTYQREWIDLATAPDVLPAWCRRHGEGRVSQQDVRRARGTVVVEIKAAPSGGKPA